MIEISQHDQLTVSCLQGKKPCGLKIHWERSAFHLAKVFTWMLFPTTSLDQHNKKKEALRASTPRGLKEEINPDLWNTSVEVLSAKGWCVGEV